jgi:hypothetical protein
MTSGRDALGINPGKETPMSSTLFLRRVLALDSLSCLAMGALMGFGAAALAPLFGLPEGLIRTAGLLLLPLGAFIGWLAARPVPPRALVWIVILGNLVWTAESFALLAQRDATALGTAFVAAQALAVLGLAGLEYLGLRKAVVTA